MTGQGDAGPSGGEAGRRTAGELEAAVLAVLTAAGTPLSPAEVRDGLGDGLAYSTVMTILSRLAASTPPGRLGRTMGAAEAGRNAGDAGGPVLVGAFGLVSLTLGLGAPAAALLACAALIAPRNHARREARSR